MKIRFISSLVTLTLCSFFFAGAKQTEEGIPVENRFAPEGFVAYAASYSSNVSDEPQYSTQYNKTFQYLSLGTALDNYRGDSVKVGIIDSGINYDHEDFMVSGSSKVKGDSKFYKYQNSRWEYYKASQHGYSYIDDTLGHGTNVAATVAAAINSVGGTGLAPNVELYVYKVTNTNNGYEFGAIQSALTDAQTLGLDVINMSFQSYEHAVSYGGSSMSASTGCSTILSSWLNQAYNAGITLVGAAGNFNTNEPSYPGSNDHVINVGSLNQSGTDKAGFSNYGSTIDLVAPGYVYVADEADNTAYTNTQGTSFSAPLVTAAIALYIQQNPSATPYQIEQALYASCDPIDDSGSSYTNWAGNGALNVERFLGLDTHLNSISIATSPSKTIYTAGETFDPTGLVINRTYSDESSDTFTYSGHTSEFSFIPSLTTPLTTSDTSVTITYDGKNCSLPITVNAAPEPQTLTITRSSFINSGGYAWYNWSQNTSNGTSVSGKAELYTTTTTSMQFNKNSGNKVAALFNTTAIPGSITKIEATTASGTNRSWNAYVTSTACSASGSTLTFGSNKTTVGSNITIGTSSTTLGTSTAGYSYFCLQENVTSVSYISEFKITYTPKSLSSIAVKTAPTKTVYESGEYFNPTGLVITATYSDNSTTDINYASASSSFTFSPSTSTTLTTSNTSVTITYGGKSCSQPITVSQAVTLSSISLSGSYKTAFVEGDEFSYGGIVTANFSDGSHTDVTSSAIFTGYNLTNIGNQTVTVSYTFKNVEATKTYNINVAAGILSSIAVSGQTTIYQKNAEFSFDGVCTATFENGYHKEVTPTSVSSPDMSKTGNKTITVSYTYNGKTETTEYIISVTSYREVIETTTTSIYCTYDFSSLSGTSEIKTTSGIQTCYSSSGGITSANVSSNSKTYANNGYLRLATGSATGSVAFNFGTFKITDVKVVAHGWSSSEAECSMSITYGGSVTTTSDTNLDTFEVHLSTATNAITLSASSNNRICLQSVTFYVNTSTSVDIGHSEDCQGLETFINNYMHMDYTDNLGYCSDSTHHYYATAKDAFNLLNDHQRKLFTSNSAYLVEWTRLSTWASKNGDTLNSSTLLVKGRSIITDNINNNDAFIVVLISGLTIISFIGLIILKKRKKY